MNAREDSVLLAMFDAEVETHMAALSEGLIALEQDPTQSQWYEPLMRAAHCIKGASDLFDLKHAVKVSHVIEDTFTSAREGRLAITSPLVDVLFTGVDLLGRVTQIDADTVDQTENIQQWFREIDQVSLGIGPEAPPPSQISPQLGTGPDPLTQPMALDGDWVDVVHREVGEWVASGTEDLKMNLSKITHLDASGLALLFIASRESNGNRGLILEGVSPRWEALLSAFGVVPKKLERSH
jgi:two-component system sensor histidine kinase and response regulator WspE